MANSITLDGTEYVFVERNGFTQRVPVASLSDYQSTFRAAQATALANVLVVAKTTCGALDTAGGVAAWQNPEAGDIAIVRAFLDVTTIATSAATVDIGATAVSAATSSDTLLDGLDVHSATGLFDNLINHGTNGLAQVRLAAGKWVTASKASGTCVGLAGSLYVVYLRL